MDLTPTEHEQLRRLALAVRSRQTTQLQIAAETGIHQSQVSRILAGNVRRASPNAQRLCNYAERFLGVTSGVSPEDSLARAVQAVWNGTTAHAEALADILSAIGRAQATFRHGA